MKPMLTEVYISSFQISQSYQPIIFAETQRSTILDPDEVKLPCGTTFQTLEPWMRIRMRTRTTYQDK